MWKCGTSFWVVKTVMATENCGKFSLALHRKWKNWEKTGEKPTDDCALPTLPCAFPRDDKENSIFLGAFSRFASSDMRPSRILCRFLAFVTWSASFSSPSRHFFGLFYHKRLSRFSTLQGWTWFARIFRRRMWKPRAGHVEARWFLPKKEREKCQKIRSKRTFGRDFRSIFPVFSEVSPLFGGLGWVGRWPGGAEKRTWNHPTTRAFGSNKWELKQQVRRLSLTRIRRHAAVVKSAVGRTLWACFGKMLRKMQVKRLKARIVRFCAEN